VVALAGNDSSSAGSRITLRRQGEQLAGTFTAMGSPCEVLVDSGDPDLASQCVNIAAEEAWRIEGKFSRYRDDNIVFRINNANGKPVEVDEETARLLDFGNQLYVLSEGMFDITSGVLRKAWKFDGGSGTPSGSQVKALLQKVGWNRVSWISPLLSMPSGMEIDFGGIGKEFAVDRAAALVAKFTAAPCLVNFGGDLAVTGPRAGGKPWRIGIESLQASLDLGATKVILLGNGALTTSGDSRRYVMHKGKRLGHILDPRTGWPVQGAPCSVTVAADTCVQAGMLSTLGMLQGADCEAFLDAQEVRYWCQR